MKLQNVSRTCSLQLWAPVVVVAALTDACAGTDRPFTPSPLITPDVIAIRTGLTQVFTVSNRESCPSNDFPEARAPLRVSLDNGPNPSLFR
jgi:hypothetical protein